jgi:hypothetical protein
MTLVKRSMHLNLAQNYFFTSECARKLFKLGFLNCLTHFGRRLALVKRAIDPANPVSSSQQHGDPYSDTNTFSCG